MKIFLVDDHQIFRDSLRLLFSFEGDLEVVGEASDGQELLLAMESGGVRPDVILMDISMGGMDGVETSRLVKQMYPGIKILILSMNSDQQSVIGALEAGVNGYLLKSAGKNEVLMAIRAVNEGSSYYSNAVSEIILDQLLQQRQASVKPKLHGILSEREIEVLSLIAKQYSSNQIGEILFISSRTVDSHRRNMLEKLGLKNTAGLVRYAIENGLA